MYPLIGMGGCVALAMQEFVVIAVEAEDMTQPILAVAPRLVTECMNKHGVLVNAVMFLRPNTIPVDATGTKQRQLLKQMIGSGQFVPVHVIINQAHQPT